MLKVKTRKRSRNLRKLVQESFEMTLCTILWTWLCLPLLVTLLPPKYQQPHKWSHLPIPQLFHLSYHNWLVAVPQLFHLSYQNFSHQARLPISPNGLVLGGPPDLLPTLLARLPDCHYRLARAGTQMHHRSKLSSLGLFPGIYTLGPTQNTIQSEVFI